MIRRRVAVQEWLAPTPRRAHGPGDSRFNLEASIAIEQNARWLIFGSGIADLPEAAVDALLPRSYSPNLTGRVNIVLLAYGCSAAATPLTNGRLEELGVGCAGRTPPEP